MVTNHIMIITNAGKLSIKIEKKVKKNHKKGKGGGIINTTNNLVCINLIILTTLKCINGEGVHTPRLMSRAEQYAGGGSHSHPAGNCCERRLGKPGTLLLWPHVWGLTEVAGGAQYKLKKARMPPQWGDEKGCLIHRYGKGEHPRGVFLSVLL